jgi:hypothetical protein
VNWVLTDFALKVLRPRKMLCIAGAIFTMCCSAHAQVTTHTDTRKPEILYLLNKKW